jgi:predicted transcriptional regulator
METDDNITSVLADKYTREILTVLTNEELSSQQIASKLDMPTSTAYRKIKNLEELNLIKKTKVVRTIEGLSESYYKSMISEINVNFKGGKMTYSIERIKMDDKIVRLWQKFKD